MQYIATISTGKKSAGIWINEALFGALKNEGASHPADDDVVLLRVCRVDEKGITFDTFQGDICLTYNFQDKTYPERFSKGRISKDWNDIMVRYGGLYHPVACKVQWVEHGKFFIPHPIKD